MTFGWLLAMLFPGAMARIFTTDQTQIQMAAEGIRFNMLLFPVIGFQAVITNFFQCIGRVKISIFLSLSRQLLFLLPLVLVLPLFWGLRGVWVSLPASDGVASVVTAVVMWRYMSKIRANG